MTDSISVICMKNKISYSQGRVVIDCQLTTHRRLQLFLMLLFINKFHCNVDISHYSASEKDCVQSILRGDIVTTE